MATYAVKLRVKYASAGQCSMATGVRKLGFGQIEIKQVLQLLQI